MTEMIEAVKFIDGYGFILSNENRQAVLLWRHGKTTMLSTPIDTLKPVRITKFDLEDLRLALEKVYLETKDA